MDNIVNNYWINNDLEVLVCDDEGTLRFMIVNTDAGWEEEISERAAMLMCVTPDSSITTENWGDFIFARGVFMENN
tara:strand:+ start:192 stop:419 length:228 start_codon:yes stop_codon:yes gene_type:complete